MKWVVTETTEHIVEGDTREDAEETYLAYGPGPGQSPMVRFAGVIERSVEEAVSHV